MRGETGEENSLPFETFPHAALVKTYNIDAQIPDSAGTASALNTGVKTRFGEVSTRADAAAASCADTLAGHPATLAELARDEGKAIGMISTSLITDATPAAVYAHSPDRGWMVDSAVPDDAKALGCKDIAVQLLEFAPEVALGGGRMMFLPDVVTDPERDDVKGRRADGRDLTQEWLGVDDNAAYVWNSAGFGRVDTSTTSHLLGLFEPSVMRYEADRDDDVAGEPSLSDMTRAAIEILSRDDKGYYLMVEGGRVDHGHHIGNAYRALTDAIEFSEAVRTALEMVDLSETLILVTADHSHTMTISGYSRRGNPILGLSKGNGGEPTEPTLAADGKPYTTLGYANGMGAWEGERPALTQEEVLARDYKQQATVPTGSETHAGEDVALFAIGPWSHLVAGVMEQNVVFHIMKHAMGLSD